MIWYLMDDPRLSGVAAQAFDEATSAGQRIYVPSICIVEATYLIEKGRISEQAFFAFESVVADPDSPIRLIELTFAIAKAVRKVSREAIPDMPDRIITATAIALGLPLITCDSKIRASGVTTIW
ncbi:MAG: PIN domain-containing protein [Bryobacterales bacterium]|nr:PIN domain-containing protein [Bryobacterales bacterium]